MIGCAMESAALTDLKIVLETNDRPLRVHRLE